MYAIYLCVEIYSNYGKLCNWIIPDKHDILSECYGIAFNFLWASKIVLKRDTYGIEKI